MARHRSAIRLVVLSLLVWGLTLGCGVKKETAAAETPAVEASAAGTQPATQTAVAALATPDAAPPAGAVVATTDGEKPGIRVDVNEVKRDATGTVTVKLTFVNGSDKEMGFSYDFGDPAKTQDYGSIGGVHLLDNVNRQKLDVMRDADDNCVCSRKIDSIAPGSQSKVWAKFTAPPENVSAVTIVVPHFIPMENVPITR